MAAFSVSFLKKIFDRTFKTSGQVLKPFSEPEWVPKDPDFTLDDYPDSLRLLAIRESLHGHKSVIFDSQRTQRFSAPFPDSIDNYDYVQDDIAYKVIRNPNPGYQDEIKTLAEFMLGTIPLSGQIEALKVHYISQSSVLWSLTFQLEMTSTCPSNRSSEKSFGSRIGGSAQDFFLEGDSGFFSPSMNNLSFNDSSSDLSLKRRWHQLTTTSMASLSGRSESLLQIPTQESQSRKIKISVGLLITLPEKLQVKLNESNVFLEELLQRLKIGVSSHLCIKGGSKYAFVHQMYLLYCQTKEVIVTYMSTRRLHLTGWHLKNQHMEYLTHHLISLKKVLDTKEKKFFLCTWLTAFLTYNPMWAFSMVPEPEMNTKKDNEEISIRQMMQMSGKSFFYNVGETQKNDLCGGANQIAKFLLTASDRYSQCLESLIFVTSYFLRSSVIRRRKISACHPKITDDLLKPKKVVVRKRNKSEDSDAGVLFMLGENEKLVQQQKSSSGKKRESRGSLHYMKINLPNFPILNSVADEICSLPYGISISDKVLPGEVLQGCILKDEMTEKTIEDILLKDIRYHEGSKELMWIHGNVENGQTEIYSSIMQEKGDVIFAPLIADLVDNLEDSQPENVLQQTEESLFRIYLVSKLMVALINRPDQMLNLETMTKSLGVDRNDIPLLIAVASTHTPDLQLRLSLIKK